MPEYQVCLFYITAPTLADVVAARDELEPQLQAFAKDRPYIVDLREPGTHTERDQQIIELARRQHAREGEVEVDTPAIVSEGCDNGAYVSAWVWVDFAGTAFDKSGSPAADAPR